MTGPAYAPEIFRLRAMVEADGNVARAARKAGRSRRLIYRVAGDIIACKRAERARRDLVGAWDRTAVEDREELAERFGYASAGSMAMMVRRRRLAAEARA